MQHLRTKFWEKYYLCIDNVKLPDYEILEVCRRVFGVQVAFRVA